MAPRLLRKTSRAFGKAKPQMYFNSFNVAANAVKRFIHTGEGDFNEHACALFALQFKQVPSFRKLCEAKGIIPNEIMNWQDIPTVTTSSYGGFDITSLRPNDRITVFHSSGTMSTNTSKHWHNSESLTVYEASLQTNFQTHMIPEVTWNGDSLSLTPSNVEAPHSSLAHMATNVTPANMNFAGINSHNGWRVDAVIANSVCAEAITQQRPIIVIGPAFSFVHWLDELTEKFHLPEGSRVMETGGYKGRSREIPKTKLHGMISTKLGIHQDWIVSEYGMCELGSQAYDTVAGSGFNRCFCFPSWARAQIINPNTGDLIGDGEPGLLRIYDLSNIRSVIGVQTQDLAIRRGDGFELIGRSTHANPRGCSLTLSEV